MLTPTHQAGSNANPGTDVTDTETETENSHHTPPRRPSSTLNLSSALQSHKSTIHSLAKPYRKLRRLDDPDEPPRFTIDLSLPPRSRYLQLCAALAAELKILPRVFEDTIRPVVTKYLPWSLFRLLCRVFVRKIYDREENAELKGISQATGLPMYLLVSFNVLLDLFMGCSSGAAAVRDEESDDEKGVRMMHFRTLDWDMDSLRNLVVQLEFVRYKDGPVIATSITYAGYVGILTGVRQNLSVSLNFRPHRNKRASAMDDYRYYLHILLVLLGERRSISSIVRRFLLPKHPPKPKDTAPYNDAVDRIAGRTLRSNGTSIKPLRTPSCYLCLSNGLETTVFEKDYQTSVEHRDTTFIVITNNDITPHADISDQCTRALPPVAGRTETQGGRTTLAAIFAEGEDRRKCAIDNWRRMRLFKSDRQFQLRQKQPIQNSDSRETQPGEGSGNTRQDDSGEQLLLTHNNERDQKAGSAEHHSESKNQAATEPDSEINNDHDSNDDDDANNEKTKPPPRNYSIDQDDSNLPHPSEMSISDVTELVQRYPTTNECTNFACIMDPLAGRVVWCRRWKKPISDNWILEHANRVQDMYCLRTELFFGP